MNDFTIKTHRPGIEYHQSHFFILNKGPNCGKPLKTPCPNCFVLQFASESCAENYYWLAYSLWKSSYWHQFLIGSVIPYFRIDEFTSEYKRKSARMFFEFDQHQKQIKALRLLEAQEENTRQQLYLIKIMRQRVLSWYHK